MYADLLGDPLDSTIYGDLDMHTVTVIAFTTATVMLLWIASLVVRALPLLASLRAVKKKLPLAVVPLDDATPDWIGREFALRRAARGGLGGEPAEKNEPLQIVNLPVSVAPLRRAQGEVRVGFEVLGPHPVRFFFQPYISRRAWGDALLVGEAPLAQLEPVQSYEVGADCVAAVEVPEDLGEEHFALVCWEVEAHSALVFLLNSDASVAGRYLFHIGLERPLRLEETFSSADEDHECIVCAAAPVNVILLPCRHNSICIACLARLDKCPECRAAISAYVCTTEDV